MGDQTLQQKLIVKYLVLIEMQGNLPNALTFYLKVTDVIEAQMKTEKVISL